MRLSLYRWSLKPKQAVWNWYIYVQKFFFACVEISLITALSVSFFCNRCHVYQFKTQHHLIINTALQYRKFYIFHQRWTFGLDFSVLCLKSAEFISKIVRLILVLRLVCMSVCARTLISFYRFFSNLAKRLHRPRGS